MSRCKGCTCGYRIWLRHINSCALNIVNDLVFISGHAPFEGGEFRYKGKIGMDLDLLAGQRAAQSAVLGCLASFEQEVGSLDTIRPIAKLNGYVNCVESFQDLPKVTDAASGLLIEVFGSSGRHARTTVGVASLPMGVAVEIDLIVRFQLPPKGMHRDQDPSTRPSNLRGQTTTVCVVAIQSLNRDVACPIQSKKARARVFNLNFAIVSPAKPSPEWMKLGESVLVCVGSHPQCHSTSSLRADLASVLPQVVTTAAVLLEGPTPQRGSCAWPQSGAARRICSAVGEVRAC